MSDVPDWVDVQIVDAAVVFINQAVAEKVFTVEIASPGHPPEPAGNRIGPYGSGSQHCPAL
ncbi:hypothetical protein ACFL9U_16920 [Thermodesulfobacteriota bacterium]